MRRFGSRLYTRQHLDPPPGLHKPGNLILAAVLFSGAVTGANYTLFLPFGMVSFISCLICLLGGFVVGYHVLLYGLRHLPLVPDSRPRSHPARLFWAVFSAILLIDLLYLFSSAYPGILTRDSITTINQLTSGEYDNTMPFYHTVTVALFYKLGLLLFGDANAALAFFLCFQILFLAAVFAYSVTTLYQAGCPKWFLAAAFCVYALLPYNIVYSATVWKDVLFGGAALLMLSGLYRLLLGIGQHRQTNFLCFLLGACGFCLWRTNGWYAFAAATAAMLLMARKHRSIGIAMCAVTVVCGILTGPVLTLLDVAPTNLVEAFAVPFQQLARVVANGRNLTQQEQEMIGYLFHLDQLPELYNPLTVDPVKFEALRHSHVSAAAEDLGAYIRMYLKLGLRYPGDYLAAWVEETKGYWNGGYDFWIYPAGEGTQSLGIQSLSSLKGLFAAWFRLLEIPVFFRVLYAIGLQVWITAYCWLMNLWKKRREALLAIPLLVLVIGLWLGSPVYAEFRYAYPLFTSVPLLLGVTLFHAPLPKE